MADREDFAVGQEVVVSDDRRQYPGEILKVGRTLVTIKYGPSWAQTAQFRMDSQALNEKSYGYQTRFYTKAQAEIRTRQARAEGVLRDHGLLFRAASPKLSLGTLEAIAQVLELSDLDAQIDPAETSGG